LDEEGKEEELTVETLLVAEMSYLFAVHIWLKTVLQKIENKLLGVYKSV
jgi:hypothetical protein